MRIEQYKLNLPEAVISQRLLARALSIFKVEVLNYPDIELVKDSVLGEEQDLEIVLNKKLIHSLAAIGYFEKVKEHIQPGSVLSDDFILAVMLFELVEVDFADTLGEVEELREKSTQFDLFKQLKESAIKGTEIQVDHYNLTEDRENKLTHWLDFMNFLCDKFHSITLRYDSSPTALEIIDRRLTEYYSFIALDHTRIPEEKRSIRAELLETTYSKQIDWKEPPNWVNNEYIWLNFLGDSISFLVPIFVFIELQSLATKELLVDLIFAFRGVGLLNVWLDDILDSAEDTDRGDENLYLAVQQNNVGGYESAQFFDKILQTIDQDFLAVSTKHPKYKEVYAGFEIIKKNMLELYLFMARYKKLEVEKIELITRFTQNV